MNILLVRLNLRNSEQIKHPFHCTPPYNLKYLESILKNTRADVQLIDGYSRRLTLGNIITQTRSLKPDMIVVMVNAVTCYETIKYIDTIKKQLNVMVIAMGRMSRSDIPDDLDIYLPGEGEEEVNIIVRRLLSGQSDIKAERERYQIYKQEIQDDILVQDLDALPFPNYTQEELCDYQFIYPMRIAQRLKWGHILSSRGCPYQCVFCSPVTRESYGHTVRLRQASAVVDEIEHLMAQGVNVISFDDDNFTTSKKHAENVCREIMKRNLRISWLVHGRINNMDFDLLALMQQAGCRHIRFGIESGSPQILERIQKTSSGLDWIKAAKEIFNYSHQLKIATTALFVLGNPAETMEDIEMSIQLAKELKPDIVQLHFFSPYPGSQSYEQLKEGLDQDDVKSMYHYNLPSKSLSAVGLLELRRSRSKFYRQMLFNPLFILKHLCAYSGFYCCNPDVLLRLGKGVLSINASSD
jgi:anaerobic magnesium-protoporphyrin IX monomethyl ester cyclase